MNDSVSPLDKLLFCGVVLFALLLIAVSKWSPNDGQTFQSLASVLSGFLGGFLTRIKPAEKRIPPDTVLQTSSTTITPPVEKKEE